MRLSKRLFSSLSVLLAVAIFTTPALADDHTLFGPKDLKIEKWHTHLSLYRFKADEHEKGVLIVTRSRSHHSDLKGFIVFNGRYVSIDDLFKGSDDPRETTLSLRSRNVLMIFLKGKPGTVLSLWIKRKEKHQGPVATPHSVTTNEDTPVSIDLTGSNADADALTYHVVSGPHHGSLSGSPPKLIYTPSADYNGRDAFSFRVKDGHRRNKTAKVSIKILPVNDAPVAHVKAQTGFRVAERAVLDGRDSKDVEGSRLTYAWSFRSLPDGSGAHISDPAAAITSFVPDRPGTYEVDLVVNDGEMNSDPITVSIRTENSRPVAEAGANRTVGQGQDVTLDGCGSTDLDGDRLSYVWSFKSIPAGSNAALSDPNALRPTFTVDAEGRYEIELVVDDGVLESRPDTVIISTENSPPVADAGPDQTVDPGQKVVLDGSGSFDVDGDLLSYTWTIFPSSKKDRIRLSHPDTINPSFVVRRPGTYRVRLVVHDGKGQSSRDWVQFSTFDSRPKAEAGVDQQVYMTDIAQLDGSGSGDADGDPLTYFWSFLSIPEGSEAALSDTAAVEPTFLIDLPGIYVLQLMIFDGNQLSVPDTVTVTTMNSPPAANDDYVSTDEDNPMTIADVLANDWDAEKDPLTLIGFKQASHGTLEQNGDGTFTYIPVKDFSGSDHFVYQIADGQGGTAEGTVFITVNPVNDPPTAVGESTTTAEDTSIDIDVVSNDTDVDNDQLVVAAFTQGTNGSVATNPDGTLNYKPKPDFNGEDGFTYTVADQHGGTATAKVSVTVTPVNDPPVAAEDSATTDEDNPVVIDILSNDRDVDGDGLTVTTVTNGANGTAFLSGDGTVTYTPAADFNGNDVFSYTLIDNNGGEAIAEVKVTVNAVNDSPRSTGIENITVEEDAPESIIDLFSAFEDVENVDSDLTYTIEGNSNPGLFSNLSIDGANGTFNLRYEPNAHGSAEIKVRAMDIGLLFAEAVFTVTVNPVNDPPSFVTGPDQIVDADGGIQTVPGWATNSSAGPGNESGQTLNFIVSNDNSGLFLVQPAVDATTGDLTFTPAADAEGFATVSVTLKDDGGTENGGVDTSSTETFTITVMGVSITPEDVEFGLAANEQQGGGGLVGETVRILDGNVLEYRTDLQFSSPNRLGLSFKAFYNSRSDFLGALGHGWTHTYEAFLDPAHVIGSRPYIRIMDETGRSHYFEPDGSDQYKGAFHERSHVNIENSNYAWCRLDGSRYLFDGSGKLTAKEDASGNRLEIAYDTNGRLWTVTDVASGRVLTFSYNTDGRLDHISGPTTAAVADGIFVKYAYDTDQNLTAVIYADGLGFNDECLEYRCEGFKYAYTDPNDPNNLTEKRDKAGHLINTWTYDNQDRMINSFNRDGNGVGIQYISDDQVVVTDAYGTLRTYGLSDIGGRRRVSSMNGIANAPYSENNVIEWGYDDEMRLMKTKSAGGTINLYEDYDARGNPETIILAADTNDERVISFTYHPAMNVPLSRTDVSVFQPGGTKVTIWDYDNDSDSEPNEAPTNLLSHIIERGYTLDAAGDIVPYEYTTSFTYNFKGQVLRIDGPLPGTGDVTSFSYDLYDSQTGDLLSIVRPMIGSTSFIGYDDAGQVGSITDVNHLTENMVYDAKGRVTEITHPDSSTSGVSYNTAGLPDSRTDEDGVTHTFEYDNDYGRLVARIDQEDNYIVYDYDDQGNMIEKDYYDPSDTLTNRKRYLYQDAAHNMPGLLYKEINPDDTFTEYTYDPEGNIASVTDPNGNTTTYDYDPLNRLIEVTQPGNIITSYTYDIHGNLASVKDALGHVTTYQYDDMGRLVSTTSPDTGTVTYTYDAAGNLINKTDAKGITVNYLYDDLNRLNNVSFQEYGSLSAYNITYTYDEGQNGIGRRTGITDPSGDMTFSYDNRGRLVEKTSIIENISYSMSRSFTPGGRRSSFTYPSGRVVDYLRNDCKCSVDEVSTTFNGLESTLLSNVSYRPFGGMKGLNTGSGGTVAGEFDSLGRVKISNPGTDKQRTYSYDNNGNLTSIEAPGTPLYNRTYDYDALNRLMHAEGSFGLVDYTYDDVGNRLTRVLGDETETYSYLTGNNILDKITNAESTNYSYDANGNTTSIGEMVLSYNQNNRLIKVEKNSDILGTYVYNGMSQRIIKEASGARTIFHYDFDGNIIGESDPGGNFQKEYLYNGKNRIAMVDVASGEIFYFLNDRLRTPQMLTDSSNTVVWEAIYKPFGEANIHPQSNVVNNFRFPGQYYDEETGLHYNYHRYYDPATGRYMTTDPLGLEGGLNLFTYVDNNPINFLDILGLAKYRVYWSVESVSYLGMGGAEIKGLVIAMNKNAQGLYDAIEFKGLFLGVSVGSPYGVTVNNTEIFEDQCEKPNVRRIQGLSWFLSGTAAFDKEGISGGAFYFGSLRGTNKNPSKVEGFDLSGDYLGGYIWTVGPIQNVRHHELH